MAVRSTPRKRDRLAIAAIVVGLALPACAFWQIGDLDAHATDPDAQGTGDDAQATDATFDASAGDAPRESGKGTSFCSDAGDNALFCDDFDSDAAMWTTTFTCIACTQTVAAPDAGGAPSPPNVIFLEAPAGEATPSSFRTETILGKYNSVTSSFWGWVDESDSNGQPAFQELAYEVDDQDFFRIRVFVYQNTLWIGTAVTSTLLASPTFDTSHSASFTQGTWFHIVFNITTQGSMRTYSWTVGDAGIVDAEPIPNGDKVVGDVTRVDLRSGIFYIGNQPTNGDTKYRMDNVLLTSP